MRLAAVLLAALLLTATAVLAACGGSSSGEEEHAKASFGVYRNAEAQRKDAEGALNHAFRDLSSAAGVRDRAGAMAAVGRGEDALQTIYSALAVEVEAADALAHYGPTRQHGGRLRDALRRTRAGAELVDRQLAIASRDPFLDFAANVQQVHRLSSELLRVAVPAALARRRAVRAIALKLGVEPPVDVLFDLPHRTVTTGG
jgi:hypothetical protein